MAPPIGHEMSRTTVQARRRRIVLLTGRGWSSAEIAREVNLSRRQIMRHLEAERIGRPAGKPVKA